MFSDEEKNIFIEYSLQNEENLKISINGYLSFDSLREKIIRQFIESAEKSIKAKLSDDWEVDNSIKNNVFERWGGLFVYKKAWNGEYKIGFSSDKYGAKGFIIGVCKNETAPHIDGLLEKLNSEYRQGTQSNDWNWYQWLDHPYLNWDNEEVLLKMYRNEATEYFTQHIESIKSIVSELIDSHVIR